MSLALPNRADLEALIRLALPVIVVQVGLMLMGVVDVIVVGHLSAEALAAVALGNLYVLSLSALGIGVLLALDPLVAQAAGARDQVAVVRALQRGLVLAALLSVPTSLVLVPGEVVLRWLQQPAEIVPLAAGYARCRIPGVLAYFLFVALRQTLQAMESMRSIVVATAIANIINAVLDVILVFGVAGFPALGAIGSAWATTASRWMLVLLLIAFARRELTPLLARLDPATLELEPLLRVLRLGLPIGLQLQLELAAFGVIALFMGFMGAVEMAAHQVAINLASLSFMVPLGVSGATAVRVGQAVGATETGAARRAASAGLLCGAGFMAVCALAFLSFPGTFAGIYTSSAEVRTLAATLIPIAGFFQIADGLQIVSTGVLRGLGDTRAPMLVNVVGFWLVGMPVSLVLAFALRRGPTGLWWGLVAGLTAVAVFLLLRVALRLAHPTVRVCVE